MAVNAGTGRVLNKKTVSHTYRKSKHHIPLFSLEHLNTTISRSVDRFLSLQDEQGYWVFDFEADTTIPSEYLMLNRFLGRELSPEFNEKICRYIRSKQLPDGGWPLFTVDGRADISASVKSYFALKVYGDSPDAPHMEKARQLILNMGGAARVNVFTRITLAMFGQIPWRTAPYMPVEIMLLPRWFFFHLNKISYWARTVLVPLLILYAKTPVCRLSSEEQISELFIDPPSSLEHIDGFESGNFMKNIFILIDRVLKKTNGLIPSSIHKKAINEAVKWTVDHMQGEGGIGAIYPAMANAVMALKVLGHPESDPDYQRGLKAIDELIIEKQDMVLCQPCHSPIWDTCLSLAAVLEAGLSPETESVEKAADWLFSKQILHTRGEWALKAPDLEPGGWAFQFENDFYPDIDDSPMVVMSLLRAGALDKQKYRRNIEKAVNWIIGMQSSDGGWGAFDIDNNYLYLNNIPFADHGALLDPSTSDVTAHCVEMFAMLGYKRGFPPVARAIKFLKKEQEASGAWYGRWGVNYIYGTWSVLVALSLIGEDMSQPYIQKAVNWLKSVQNKDHGWGETCYTYNDPSLAGMGLSTPSQTSWALLGLMAAGETNSPEVQSGIHYLISSQKEDGSWEEKHFTGTGFPKVFYILYHGYSQYFPLWTLSVYRRLLSYGKTLQDEMTLDSPPELDLPALKKK